MEVHIVIIAIDLQYGTALQYGSVELWKWIEMSKVNQPCQCVIFLIKSFFNFLAYLPTDETDRSIRLYMVLSWRQFNPFVFSSLPF